jgi:hypothetical protein
MSEATNQSQLADEWIWKPALAAFLRNPFEGAGHIRKNYSQAFQDIFVLSILDGLKNGRYLEIGAQRPILNNNTYLLHKKYKWSGISIEIDPAHLFEWRKERPKCELIVADALKINYGEAFANWFRPTQASSFWTRSFRTQNNVIRDDNRIDYLQLDIDPSINTLRVLRVLPLDSYRFSVITFETDAYIGDLRARDESRNILFSNGYELIAADVSVLYSPVSSDPIPFEDWWVDPLIVNTQKIRAFRAASGEKCLPQNLLLSSYKHGACDT